jgi:hypothetical protein
MVCRNSPSRSVGKLSATSCVLTCVAPVYGLWNVKAVTVWLPPALVLHRYNERRRKAHHWKKVKS